MAALIDLFYLLTAFNLIGVIFSHHATMNEDDCRANEVYSECGNYQCQNSCTKPNNTDECYPCLAGCVCISGYLRNSAGDCVPPSECDCCERNEELVLCPSKCPETCDDIALNENAFPTPDPNWCKPACRCKKNFKRNKRGRCVHISKCRVKCDLHEEFNKCPSSCEDIGCQEFISGEKSDCPPLSDIDLVGQQNKNCYRPRCECLPGFVRKEGSCVSQSECCDDPNSELVKCPHKCVPTCDSTPSPDCVTKCPKRACVCREKFVLNANGQCVPPQNCPAKKCLKKTEIFVTCPGNCPPEATCKDYLENNDDPVVLPKNPQCFPACKCLSGYFRNAMGDCVSPEYCCDDPNAIVVQNPNPCAGGTCQNPQFQKCRKECSIRGCQCKPGYVMKSEDDTTCVLLSDCPERDINDDNNSDGRGGKQKKRQHKRLNILKKAFKF